MHRISLSQPSPIPRAKAARGTLFEYQLEESVSLPIPTPSAGLGLFSVIGSRASRREFEPVALEQLSSFFWYVAKQDHRREPGRHKDWSHRRAPSAGGLHPVDLLLFNATQPCEKPSLYDARRHVLHGVIPARPAVQDDLWAAVANVVEPQRGCVVWFAAQLSRTSRYYRNAESLIWRDAGVLLGYMSLVAEALGMNFCPLGMTGEPHISKLFNSKGKLVGVGGAVLGSRQATTLR